MFQIVKADSKPEKKGSVNAGRKVRGTEKAMAFGYKQLNI